MFGLIDEWLRRRRLQAEPEGLAFDARWGTETSRFDLDNYEPTRPSVLEQALDRLGERLMGRSFVDLGSGKGRAVLIAAQRGFVRCVGIEHDLDLHEVAEANAVAWAARGGGVSPVFFLHGDAARIGFPEGPLVVFLYNPFPRAVVQRVFERLGERDAWVLYLNPLESDAIPDGWEVDRWGESPWEARLYRSPAVG